MVNHLDVYKMNADRTLLRSLRPDRASISLVPETEPEPDLPPPGETQLQSSVTHDGFTWTFDQQYEVGVYDNAINDPFVVAPAGGVVVTGITCLGRSTGGNGTAQQVFSSALGRSIHVHGSTLNPRPGNLDVSGSQGYHSDPEWWSEAENVAYQLPLTIVPDVSSGVASLVSSEGATGDESDIPWSSSGDPTIHNRTRNALRPAVRRYAILTVVSTAPSAGAFRPSYVGRKVDNTSAVRVQKNTANINLTRLPNVPIVGRDQPGWTGNITNWTRRPRITHFSGWQLRKLQGMDNNASYALDYAREISAAALRVCTSGSDAEKLAAVKGLIQIGIDTYGCIVNGAGFEPRGGHHMGRLLPIVFAAAVLNDTDMKALRTNYSDNNLFQEIGNTYWHGYHFHADSSALESGTTTIVSNTDQTAPKDGRYGAGYVGWATGSGSFWDKYTWHEWNQDNTIDGVQFLVLAVGEGGDAWSSEQGRYWRINSNGYYAMALVLHMMEAHLQANHSDSVFSILGHDPFLSFVDNTMDALYAKFGDNWNDWQVKGPGTGNYTNWTIDMWQEYRSQYPASPTMGS